MNILQKLKYSMNVIAISQLQDNYAYCIFAQPEKGCILIDVSEEGKVIDFLKSTALSPVALLSTHKHMDHCAGNIAIKSAYSHIKIYGHKLDMVPCCTDYLEDNSVVEIAGIKIKSIHTPCHTVGHLVYYTEPIEKNISAPLKSSKAYEYNNIQKALFTGDTLFIGGCGRFFEGDAKDMVGSLNKLKMLPKDTSIFCGHEYTVSNLEFALKVDKTNPHIIKGYNDAKSMQALGKPTIPSTIENELSINVFMRTHEEYIQNLCHAKTQEECMKTLREAKNANKF